MYDECIMNSCYTVNRLDLFLYICGSLHFLLNGENRKNLRAIQNVRISPLGPVNITFCVILAISCQAILL